MEPKLLTEFPSVSYDVWRAQVEQDLKSKGADFDKRLLTRTLEGLVIQPLYTQRDVTEGVNGAGTGLPQSLRASAAAGVCDVRAEQVSSDLATARRELMEDLTAGATSLWLRLDLQARTADMARTTPDGLHISDLADLATLLAGVDLARVGLAFDAGGNVAIGALVFAHARNTGIAPHALRGTIGCDPLGALARDGALPYALERAPALLAELCRHTSETYPQLRAAQVASDAYHLAGASCSQELAYALATGCEYLRWCLDAGLSVTQASAQIGFRVSVASDLFLELAKLRALRLAWAKIIAAHGGDESSRVTHIHALTSPRSQTRRDPWVNMLRTTTEAFAALVGGADAVTTRAFDAALGHSDEFARRIARNVQVILNEEAHVAEVADAAGGSYYVETLTDQLARAAFQLFQGIERQGGMSAALASGQIAREIAATARDRATSVAKRLTPLTGVSEFANLFEEPVRREPAAAAPARVTHVETSEARNALVQLEAAASGERLPAAMQAAQRAAALTSLTRALAGSSNVPARGEPLPVRRNADGFEALRDRCERHAATSGQLPSAFLCNLGAIPKHKARASFATGFCNAGGIVAIDNDGFQTVQEAVEAFSATGTSAVVICGSDDQYPDWVSELAPALRARGARHILLAGRPGDRQPNYEQAGVSAFVFVGVDVVTMLRQLLDGMGVAQ